MAEKFDKYYRKIKYLIACLLSFKRPLYVTIWNPVISPKRYSNNIGDDLNVPLLELITGRFIWPVQWSFHSSHRECFSVIGSLIPWWINCNTIVWGSGIKEPDPIFYKKPRKVYAVRGPYTRDVLLRNGVTCPDIYGDPAILMPLIYEPESKTKRYRYGIILHERDSEDISLVEGLDRLGTRHSLIRIDITSYVNWKDVIDMIVSCDIIVSSSLHGLILSDAYRVPSVWAKFGYDFGTGYIKFWDYFETVGRKNEKLIEIRELDGITELSAGKIESRINIEPLIKSCPFPNDLLKRYRLYMSKHAGRDVIYTLH